MLKRLRVRGFKSLTDVDVTLAPLVVVMGPNAVGKSNFLEAMLLLSHLVTERRLSDAFSGSFRGLPLEAFTLPTGALKELLARDTATLGLDVELSPTADAAGPRCGDLRYRVELLIRPRSGVLEVADEYLARLDGDHLAKRPSLEREDGHLTVRRPGEARREPLGLSHTLASNRQLSGEELYPDFDCLRHEVSAWRAYYLDPRTAMRQPRPPMETDDIGPRGENIAPFLYRLYQSEVHHKFFAAIRRALASAVPTVEDLDIDLDPHRGILDILVTQEGIRYTSRVISEGTLRILALCAIAASPWPGRLVAFEEPENGVHPRRLETIADLLLSMAAWGERQVVVTTHSPELVGAMARRQRAGAGGIRLLRCFQVGGATRLVPFEPAELQLDDPELRSALAEPDDLLIAALRRGWLDG